MFKFSRMFADRREQQVIFGGAKYAKQKNFAVYLQFTNMTACKQRTAESVFEFRKLFGLQILLLI